MTNQRPPPWIRACFRIKSRLEASVNWYPYPFFISIGLFLILTDTITLGLNPRLGNPSELIDFQAPRAQEGAIWFSVTPKNDRLVITTDDRRVIYTPLVPELSDLGPLIDYLKYRVQEDTLAAGLSKRATKTQTSVVIASDRTLKYFHMRTILYALAEAKIAHFGFETRRKSQKVTDL